MGIVCFVIGTRKGIVSVKRTDFLRTIASRCGFSFFTVPEKGRTRYYFFASRKPGVLKKESCYSVVGATKAEIYLSGVMQGVLSTEREVI